MNGGPPRLDPAALRQAAARIDRELAAGRGMRLGETTVLSTKVHTIERGEPDTVAVAADSDAGRAFYGWATPGRIYHLDVFHADAEVPPERIAAALRDAALAWCGGEPGAADLLDRIDLQTGGGGGRASGRLCFGRGEALRAAHRNHVHLAWWWEPGETPLALLLVAAVEGALQREGVEIRRLRRVVHARGGAPVDLSPYADDNDSHLRPPPGARAAAPAEGAAMGAPLPARTLADLVDLAGGLDRLRDAVRHLETGTPKAEWGRSGAPSPAPAALLRQLRERGLAYDEGGRVGLTEAGLALHRALRDRLRQIDAHLREAFRRPARRAARARPALRSAAGPRHRHRTERRAAPASPGEPRHAIDPAATALAAARRALAAGARPPLRVAVEDVFVCSRRRAPAGDVCLLLDCSASMAGRRMAAARFLARHLLLSTRDRVAVLAFQESDVRVAVPFTRRFRTLDEGLRTLQPGGLTPMAEGLAGGCAYLRQAHARHALLLLITDGIPTVPKWSVNPVDDALRAAADLAAERVVFACIGLEPSRTYLEGIAHRGRGRLYVLDDLDDASLADVARTELRRAGRWRG